MAELLGLGCSHGPIISPPPEVWAKGRERVFARIPHYQPPPQLVAELGQDNGLSQDREDQRRAGPDYPPRPTPRRCYELGSGIRRFLDTRPERVAVVASSSWSHSFLAHKFQCRAIDIDTDRRYLELLRRGADPRGDPGLRRP